VPLQGAHKRFSRPPRASTANHHSLCLLRAGAGSFIIDGKLLGGRYNAETATEAVPLALEATALAVALPLGPDTLTWRAMLPFWTVPLSLADCSSTIFASIGPSTGCHHTNQGRCVGKSALTLPAVTWSMSASARIIGLASTGEVINASATSATKGPFISSLPVRLTDTDLDTVTAGNAGTDLPAVAAAIDRMEARLAAVNTRLVALLEASDTRTGARTGRVQAVIQTLLLQRAALEHALSRLNGTPVTNGLNGGVVIDGDVTRSVQVEGNGHRAAATATASAPNGRGSVQVAASVAPGRSVATSRSSSSVR
jgi:hypothetical protein